LSCILLINVNKVTFKLICIFISILFAFHISNDLDLNGLYLVNTSALEDNEKENIYSSYIFDPSEYFEEDNMPQNNNIINNNYNYNRNSNNNQLTLQQQLEDPQIRQQGKFYDQIKNRKYEFTSIESKNNEKNNDNNIKSDEYVTFQTVLNLANIEKTGFIRLVAYINGQSFKEDIPLSAVDMSKNKLNVKLKVLKDIGFVSLDTPDEFFACAYHVKDINREKNSILYFDCNEADVQSSDGKNKVRLFKPSSMVYSDSNTLYNEQTQQQGQGQQHDSKEDYKVLLKIISPLSDRKDTKQLKIAVAIRGQIQIQMINDVQEELDKSKDYTITRTFTFDRKTDLGNIQIGDRFHACVSSDDLNPPEGQECEKRLVKKFNSPNSLPAR